MGCSSNITIEEQNLKVNKKIFNDNYLQEIEDSNIEDEKFIIKSKIGNGSFGEVMKVLSNKNNKNYVVKIMQIDENDIKIKYALNEYLALKECHHPNILKYKQIFKQNKNNIKTINIVVEYADNGNLQEKLNQNIKENKNFEENILIYYLIQICLALSYFNKKHIIHRNIKPSNIFLTKSNIIKIGDLCLSKRYKQNLELQKQNSIAGTLFYISPEMNKNRIYNGKTDIYSLGKTFLKLINCLDLANNSEMYSEDFLNLINFLLNEDPNERPSADEILQNSFIQKKMKEFLVEHHFENSFAYTILQKLKNNGKLQDLKQEEDLFIKNIKKELDILNKEINQRQNNINSDLEILMSIIFIKLNILNEF